MSDKRVVCFYHKGCMDGWASAFVVYTFMKLHGMENDVDFIAVHYGDTPVDVTDKEVYVVDFSFPRDTLLDMEVQAESLLVIDHHKTAQEALQGLDFCVFDMGICGATLTWKTLMGEHAEVPPILKYVEDRDLWNWQLESSREVSEALRTYPMEFSTWEDIIEPDYIHTLISEGGLLLKKKNEEIGSIIERCTTHIEFEGYRVPCVNSSMYQSEIGNIISEPNGVMFGIIWYINKDGMLVCSLRSNKEHGVDVSAIAKLYDGGGHRNAAGFTSPIANLLLR